MDQDSKLNDFGQDGPLTASDGQKSQGFVPMNLIDDLWPESEEALVPQGKVAMAELFDSETESNVTPISAADILSSSPSDYGNRSETGGFRSVSDFEQEFKDHANDDEDELFKMPVAVPEMPVTVTEVPVIVQSPVVAETVMPRVESAEPVVAAAAAPQVVAVTPVVVEEIASLEPAGDPVMEVGSLFGDDLDREVSIETPAEVQVSEEAAYESVVAAPVVAAVAAPVAGAESLVPNDIATQAAAEAQEIEQRKLELARAQMDAASDEAAQAEPEEEEEPIEQGISVITREATVLGDIITQGHIDIVGRVKGNIDAKGDVAIHGIVRGDVGGSKIGLYDCRVKGNLAAGLGVIVDESSIIGGDVKTKNIIFDGKVKGNIDAENVVVLRSHSLTLGDVSAASLAVEPGAILNGNVRTLVDGDLEAPFEEVL